MVSNVNKFSTDSRQVAAFLGRFTEGSFTNLPILHLCSLHQPCRHGLAFAKRALSAEQVQHLHELTIFLRDDEQSTALCAQLRAQHCCIISVDDPRFEFYKTGRYLVDAQPKEAVVWRDLEKGRYVATTAKIGAGTTIAPDVVIGPNCQIGEHCTLESGVKMLQNVTMGDRCSVGANSVLGNQGFGGVRDESTGEIIMMPHLGGVIIGADVRIGSLNTVVAGTIDPTRIGDQTKLDDHIHVGHNCQLGKSCFITAHTQLGGSAVIGDRVWIGPNSSMMQGVTVGAGAYIGIATNVTKSIPAGEVVCGNPAMKLEDFKNLRRYFQGLEL